ncbi:hypothetical protein GCM10010218_08040 [Streptomyces mashuensis]|uniref:Secreted protein n=1 Tax=Streptomyces mashuensis TaxID=33904 RepID=A0A919E8R2_9ACTN|nr:hypothetical protein [Streptomyces mashuensis]GHF29278.1 hypothetical protein GCM10010218_08040 [Streptomyces mashuensis]
MKKSAARALAGLAVAGVALIGASPAFAEIRAYSPNGKAWAATGYNDTKLWLEQRTDGKSHADYYRTDDDSPYHLWNKSGGVVSSSQGATIYKVRVCEWVPDNNDNCGHWQNN